MKKLLSILTAAVLCMTYTGCTERDELWSVYDELYDRVSSLEQSVRDANTDIAALQKLVAALQSKVTIDAVTATADGYRIDFSDGTSVQITNGSTSRMPEISVKQDSDGLYYWTLDGEWMTDPATGEKVRASAVDGQQGAAGITPRIRINEQTREWEYSTDEGVSWTSTGVVAEGKAGAAGDKGDNGDSFFSSIDTSDDDYVVFTLASGGEIRLPRTVQLRFDIACDTGVNPFKYGTERSFAVTSSGVEEYMISRPDGWSVSYDGAALKVKAPAETNANAEMSGEVAVMAVAANGMSRIAKMRVEAVSYELRVLTFEDEDYKGSEGAGYWSSLIDSQEYGGPLLYGDYDYCDYDWYDEGNTSLSSGIVESYGMKVFWNGGSAVSNYTLDDIKRGDYTRQLSVLPQSNGKGGRNGSDNFCICFTGTGSSTPMMFYDGEERVIDHMYVTSTVYLLNSMIYGDGFSKPLGDDGWFAVTATGYDLDEEKTGEATIYLYRNGKFVNEWVKWDLSSLGKVLYVEFRCTGSDSGQWGLNTPGYFAFDDVAVRVE